MSCSWLVLYSQQSQSVSSSTPSQNPRGSRNCCAIKEALKRSNCQHDCLRFLAVKQCKYRSGCSKDRLNCFGNTACCDLCVRVIGAIRFFHGRNCDGVFFSSQTKDNKDKMTSKNQKLDLYAYSEYTIFWFVYDLSDITQTNTHQAEEPSVTKVAMISCL